MTRPHFADWRAHLDALRTAALRAVDPAAAVWRALSPADFSNAERIFVVGAGKAGVSMAQAAAEILGDRLTAGVLAVPPLPAHAPARVNFIEGGHPMPTAGSLAAGRALAHLLAQTTTRDLVLALISGGGSALLELPQSGLSLAHLQAVTAALLKCGATIHEINRVRARLSQLKGGGLARLAQPARVLSLILSDVVGNALEVIASGPTVLMEWEPGAALAVVQKYHLQSDLPPVVQSLLTHRPFISPWPHSPTIENRLIASNRLAGEAAAAAAAQLGFEAVWVADDWQGEAREVGRKFAELTASPPAQSGRRARCFVVGGETTVTVRGPGKGGRNQEAALAAALEIEGRPNVVISTFATDGVDGPTDAAGASVTGDTAPRARALGLDPFQYLTDNNSYPFFAALNDLVITGPSGTNVNDLMFGLAYRVC